MLRNGILLLQLNRLCSLGNLRFNLPQPNDPYSGTHTVAAFGPGCPQQALTLPIVTGLVQEAADFIANSIFGLVFPDDEDCITASFGICSGHY